VNITVQVDEVTLGTVVHEFYNDEDDVTVGDRVAEAVLKHVIADKDHWKPFRDRVLEIRDSEIRAAVKPLIKEALTKPFRQTNTYGEATGPEITLSQVIVAEAKKALTKPVDQYSRDKGTFVSSLVAAAVKEAFATEIAAEVRKARDMVTGELGDQIGSKITAAVRDALRARS
jgi:hypothetical protein